GWPAAAGYTCRTPSRGVRSSSPARSCSCARVLDYLHPVAIRVVDLKCIALPCVLHPVGDAGRLVVREPAAGRLVPELCAGAFGVLDHLLKIFDEDQPAFEQRRHLAGKHELDRLVAGLVRHSFSPYIFEQLALEPGAVLVALRIARAALRRAIGGA